jgi:hypothetical protein
LIQDWKGYLFQLGQPVLCNEMTLGFVVVAVIVIALCDLCGMLRDGLLVRQINPERGLLFLHQRRVPEAV